MNFEQVETPTNPSRKRKNCTPFTFLLKDRLSETYSMEHSVSFDFLKFVVDISRNVDDHNMFGCITDITLSDMHSPNKFLDRCGRQNGGDFSSSKIIALYKRRPAVFLSLLTTGSAGSKFDVSLRPFLTLVSELRDVSRTLGCPDALLTYIGKLMESHLFAVRFTATCFAVCILQTYARSRRSTRIIMDLLQLRMQDVNEVIRRLVTVDCMVRSFLLCPEVLLTEFHDLKTVVYCAALNDPSKTNRIYVLRFFDDLIRENKQAALMYGGSEVGKNICQLCFDDDSVEVSRLAIRILSNPEVGEFFIGNDIAMYQQIANQVWNLVSPKKGQDTLSISREAFGFVNNHILASPGLVGEGEDAEQKLEILLEFMDQYSDGLIYELNGRLVLTIFDHFKTDPEKNFLLSIDTLLYLIAAMMRNVRKEWDEMLRGSQKDFIQMKKRLNTALEILLSVLTLNVGRRNILRETQLANVLVEMLRDEEDEEFHSVSNIIETEIRPDSQLRGRRCVVEIVIEIVNVVFQELEEQAQVDMFPSIDTNLITKEKNARKKAVCLVRNFLKEFCI